MNWKRFSAIAAAVTLLCCSGFASAQTPSGTDQPIVELFKSWRGSRDTRVTSEEMRSFVDKVRLAIREGGNINASDQFGNTPLLLATYWAAWRSDGRNFNDLVALLLANGANPNAESKSGTPMHVAATGTLNAKLIEILCAAGASTKTEMLYEGKKVSPLEMARNYNSFPELKSAMEKCAAMQ